MEVMKWPLQVIEPAGPIQEVRKQLIAHHTGRQRDVPPSFFFPERASVEPTLVGYFGKGLGDDWIPEMVPGTVIQTEYLLEEPWSAGGMERMGKGERFHCTFYSQRPGSGRSACGL